MKLFIFIVLTGYVKVLTQKDWIKTVILILSNGISSFLRYGLTAENTKCWSYMTKTFLESLLQLFE